MLDDMIGGCVVPLAQSAVSAVIGALATFGLLLALGMEMPSAWLWALVGAGLAAGACWVWRLYYWHYSLVLDQTYQYDLLTQEIAEAAAEPVRVEISETDGATRRQRFIDLPATPEQLAALAQGLMQGASFSQAAWSGSDGEFTRAEFAALQSEMIRRGLARWNNPSTPARGVALTPAGRAVMRKIAGD